MKMCVKHKIQDISPYLLHTKPDIWYSEMMINSSKELQADWAWKREYMFIVPILFPSLYCTSLYCFCSQMFSFLFSLLCLSFLPNIFKLMAYCLISISIFWNNVSPCLLTRPYLSFMELSPSESLLWLLFSVPTPFSFSSIYCSYNQHLKISCLAVIKFFMRFVTSL